ncbi:hypothetical protein KTO58_08100 [Chitinophaga pendula]|uniref:condensation domain-containing protein n=1 Tax=Chitinophaga TaxID=79328 RepID=UPI000BAF1993|nr:MULTISPECIES: condensation domain-containing protein [Chitinophaga]ASZ13247.1 hypothetical protein CK934_20910 [Chitinophaga sp. MD30]UCJ09133.1 hypothetical protein KTO58_08100 [Chitinophaga pendula]
MKTNVNALDQGGGSDPSAAAIMHQVATIWKDVLALSTIDVTKGFTALGGNSIKAIPLMFKMKKAGFPVTLRDIMHYQSIEQIVKQVLLVAAVPFCSPVLSVAVGGWHLKVASGDLSAVDVGACQRLLTKALLHNDALIRGAAVMPRYALPGMQQLQLSFRTPASVDLLPLDEELDVTLLERAYGMLICEHGLLRSIPVREAGSYCWQEYGKQPLLQPVIPVLDFSDGAGTAEELLSLMGALTSRVYDNDTVLHQLVYFRRSAAERYLAVIISHVIFDRVTAEILRSQLLRYYTALRSGQLLAEEQPVSFDMYVRQLYKGPQAIDEVAVMTMFDLHRFYASRQYILQGLAGKASPLSYQFNIVVPAFRHDSDRALGTALLIYGRVLQRYLDVGAVPLLFVCEGRQYEDVRFYNTVGEFTDMVPMVIDARSSAEEIGHVVVTRLEGLKRHNLNFLHLQHDPKYKTKWPTLWGLIDGGEGYHAFDLLMFNFLGNADGPVAPVTTEVSIQPNPLPIQSLLNCIAVSAGDQLIYTFRTSYLVDIDMLRGLFYDVVKEIIE